MKSTNTATFPGKALWLFAGIFILLMVSYHPSVAQGKFSASAPKSVAENQNFNLSFSLENANGNNLKLPSLSDFDVLGGPSTSTSMQIMNGAVSQSVTYTYVLRPKKQGTFKIGKASIEVGGNTVESNEVTIQVTAPSSNPQPQQNQGNPFANDPFFNQQQQQQQPQAPTGDQVKALKNDVFVKVVLSKNSVYEGEMLTATYKLYFRQNLSGFNLTKSPSLEGFWSQDIPLDPKRRQTVETVNGRQYYTIDILKYNLYPQRAGKLQIAPAELNTTAQVQVKSRSNDPFDNFFNMAQVQNVPLTLKTDPVTITVKDLPEKDKPKSFTGIVGKFNFSTNLSSKEAKTDNPVTYTIKISGEGNLNLVDAPKVQLPPGFEVYDPKEKDDITNSAAGMTGSKQFDYLIIPRQPGDFKIPSQEFSFFDPASGKYSTITSPEYALKVTGQPSKNVNVGSAGGGVSQQDVSMLGEDIRYIKTSTPNFSKSSGSFFGSAGFFAAFLAPIFAFVGLIAVRRRSEKLAADITGSKRRRALKLAKKRLSTAEKHLSPNEKKNFYDEVSRAVWGYLGDKLNIDMAELSKDTVEEKLLAKNVKPETITRLQNLISSCELSLYSPVSDDSKLKNDYSTALNLIADLEDEITG